MCSPFKKFILAIFGIGEKTAGAKTAHIWGDFVLSMDLAVTKYIFMSLRTLKSWNFGWTKYGTDQIWLDQIWHWPNLVGPNMALTKFGWTKYGMDQIWFWTKYGLDQKWVGPNVLDQIWPTKNGRPKVSRPNLAWHRFEFATHNLSNVVFELFSVQGKALLKDSLYLFAQSIIAE